MMMLERLLPLVLFSPLCCNATRMQHRAPHPIYAQSRRAAMRTLLAGVPCAAAASDVLLCGGDAGTRPVQDTKRVLAPAEVPPKRQLLLCICKRA